MQIETNRQPRLVTCEREKLRGNRTELAEKGTHVVTVEGSSIAERGGRRKSRRPVH